MILMNNIKCIPETMVNEKLYYEKRIGVYILYISIHVKTERKFLDGCRKNCSLSSPLGKMTGGIWDREI